jgi:hypothetical protein
MAISMQDPAIMTKEETYLFLDLYKSLDEHINETYNLQTQMPDRYPLGGEPIPLRVLMELRKTYPDWFLAQHWADTYNPDRKGQLFLEFLE